MSATQEFGLVKLLGERVISHSGEVAVSTLEDKYVGFYFSAHWCPPCRGFTPKLIETYKKLKEAGKNIEIVFISSDKDQTKFDEYYAEMPWLALPYSDRDRKGAISSQFGISGIPSLLFFQDGKLVSTRGRDEVSSDPDGNNFPWRDLAFSEMLPTAFVRNNGDEVSLASVKSNTVVGLYFSAHWCGPCRNFTPKLITTYNKLRAEGKKFEIIFVSSDRDETSFNEYFSTMPWLSVPYSKKGPLSQLENTFDVEGIPSLVLIDLAASTDDKVKVINDDGVTAVMDDPDGINFPFLPKPLLRLDGSSLSNLNKLPSFIYFAENDNEWKFFEELATKYQKEWDAAGKERPVVFFYSTEEDEARDDVKRFAKVGGNNKIVLLNIPKRTKYLSESSEAQTAEVFINNFLANKLTAVPL